MNFKHFITITRHRHCVIVHGAKCGILWQTLFHDLSKYSLAEFLPGLKYYTGTKSPNDSERRDKGYSSAWLHHKGRNRHHFEYWTDYNPQTRSVAPIKMPIKYVKEMFCDRVAATKIYQGDDYNPTEPLKYFQTGQAQYIMHPETAKLLEKLLTMLATEGEKKTFAYIKTLSDY